MSGNIRSCQIYSIIAQLFSLNGSDVPVRSEAVKHGQANASNAVISKLTPH